MKHLCTTLATVLAAAFAASAKTFDWPIGSPAAKAETFTAYHGETVRFNLRLSGSMTNLAPVAIYYQTNGMGRSEWFSVPGTVFAPSNDCGAAAYRFFVRCLDPDGVDYSANGTLRMLDSPGFTPSEVPLPVKTLDFSTVTVLNAPWIEEESDPTVPAWAKAENPPIPPDPDFSTNNQQLVDTIVATSPAPGDYANVSNAALNGWTLWKENEGRQYRDPDTGTMYDVGFRWQDSPKGWMPHVVGHPDVFSGYGPAGDEYSTHLEFNVEGIPGFADQGYISIIFSRKRTRAFRTSDLINDGPPGEYPDPDPYVTKSEAVTWNGEGEGCLTVTRVNAQMYETTGGYLINLQDGGSMIKYGPDGITKSYQGSDVWSLLFPTSLSGEHTIATTDDIIAATNGISLDAADVGALPNDATLAGIANFSNAVLAVGLNIDTNTVAAINALVEAGDELPIGGAATVGGLLFALAAAVAALKRGKADTSALRYDIGVETAITSASQEVVEGVTVNYGSATLADRTANRVAITAGLDELRITFPAADSGKVRDFELRVEVGTGSAALTAPALVPVAATGETVTLENPDGAIPALADGAADAKGVTLLYFSGTAPGVFLAKGEQVKEVA